MTVPYRTGVPSIRKLARKIRALIVIFRPIMATFMTEEELTDVDNLASCCELFIDNVPNDRPYDPA